MEALECTLGRFSTLGLIRIADVIDCPASLFPCYYRVVLPNVQEDLGSWPRGR